MCTTANVRKVPFADSLFVPKKSNVPCPTGIGLCIITKASMSDDKSSSFHLSAFGVPRSLIASTISSVFFENVNPESFSDGLSFLLTSLSFFSEIAVLCRVSLRSLGNFKMT